MEGERKGKRVDPQGFSEMTSLSRNSLLKYALQPKIAEKNH